MTRLHRRVLAVTTGIFAIGAIAIGTAFAQVEAKVILARILQKYDLAFAGGRVRPHMGATLEPSPGVRVNIRRRS